jgi:thiaminase/transcriptional activator TenA
MRLFAAYVKQILDGEMDIHRGYMARLGISLADAEKAQTALDNRSYTAYMLQVGYEEGPAEIVVSILSCALSYEHIARRMLEKYPEADRHPFYGEWVTGYASGEYHEANEELIQLTERLCRDMNEQQLSHLEEIFRICSRYEMSFWDMAWEMRG